MVLFLAMLVLGALVCVDLVGVCSFGNSTIFSNDASDAWGEQAGLLYVPWAGLKYLSPRVVSSVRGGVGGWRIDFSHHTR